MKRAVKRIGIQTSIALCAVLALAQTTFAQNTATKKPTSGATPKSSECPSPEATLEIVGDQTEFCIPVSKGEVVTLRYPPGAKVATPEISPIDMDPKKEKHLVRISVNEDSTLPVEESLTVEGPDYSATVYLRASQSLTVTRANFTIKYISPEHAKARTEASVARTEASEARTEANEANDHAAASEQAANRAKEQAIASDRAAAKEKARAGRYKKQRDVAYKQRDEAYKQRDKANEQRDEANKQRDEAFKDRDKANEQRDEANKQRDEAFKDRDKANKGRDEAIRQRDEAQRVARENTRAMLIDAIRRRRDQPGALIPITEDEWVQIENSRLRVRYKDAFWLGEYLAFPADLATTSGGPFPLSHLGVELDTGEPLDSYVLEPVGFENTTKGIITTLREGKQAEVIVAAQVPPDIGPERLRLITAEHGRPPVAAQFPRYRLVPETQKQKQRRIWSKQVIVGPRVSYGACWLASGLDGDDSLESTSCKALSAYFAKGLHENFAAGAEVAVGWTGNALFEGEQSEVMRTAMHFRVTGYGDLRFGGGKTVPYLRLGVGAQATTYDVEFTGSVEPSSSSEVVPFLAFGGGIQVRLGKNFLGAAAVNATTVGGMEELSALEFGVQVGYGWNP